MNIYKILIILSIKYVH